MDKVRTRSNPSLGWDPIREALDQELPCLAIAWSREEPDRAGEVTLLDDRRVLGRGPPQPDDPAPRVTMTFDITNWMSFVDDAKRLAELSIPGTHDADRRGAARSEEDGTDFPPSGANRFRVGFISVKVEPPKSGRR